jgi:hypothetical protein
LHVEVDEPVNTGGGGLAIGGCGELANGGCGELMIGGCGELGYTGGGSVNTVVPYGVDAKGL